MPRKALKDIKHIELMRPKSRFDSSRAALSDILARLGIQRTQVKPDHTAKAWKWNLIGKKSATKKPAKKQAKKTAKKPAKKAAKKTPRKTSKRTQTPSENRGLVLILSLADNQECSDGKLKHCSAFYRRLSDSERKDFDNARAMIRRTHTKK
ncbi:hypothetical protein OAU50_02210 [Planctomycetota bacterium]|nr:hypothetical protein [Planctomycetota bacterium]